MEFLIIYTLLCLLVAWGFSNTSWGFGGGLLFCIFLSPVVGFIVMLFMPAKEDNTVQNQILLGQQQIMQQQIQHQLNQQNNVAPPPEPGISTMTMVEKLEKLEEVKKKGLIKEEEYNKLREKIMGEF